MEGDDQPQPVKQREEKKSFKVTTAKASGDTKIGKLKMVKGTLALFSVLEIAPGFIILNHTRNTKAYMAISKTQHNFELGDIIPGVVIGDGTAKYVQGSGHQNKKIQVKLDLTALYKGLNPDDLKPKMVLFGKVLSRESKGFMIDFQFKSRAKGFIKFDDENKDWEIGQYKWVSIESVHGAIVRVVNAQGGELNERKFCLTGTDFTTQTVKPGFVVQAKVVQMVDNGIKVSFLGGFNGTIFCDHIQGTIKQNDKISARIIAIDTIARKATLSLLPHIMKLEHPYFTAKIGTQYHKISLSKQLYGGSYSLTLPDGTKGFLHKTHQGSDEPLEVLDQVFVKELNYFDGVPILTTSSKTSSFAAVETGSFQTGTISEVHKDHVVIQLSDTVIGRLHLEHMSDQPIKHIPPKFAQVGKELTVRVWNAGARSLEFTKKRKLYKKSYVPALSVDEIRKGDKIRGLIVSKVEHGYVISLFAGLKGLLTFAESLGQEFKVGQVIKAYVLFKNKDGKLGLTLKDQSEITGKMEDFEIMELIPSKKDFKKILSDNKGLPQNLVKKDLKKYIGQIVKVEPTDQEGIVKSKKFTGWCSTPISSKTKAMVVFIAHSYIPIVCCDPLIQDADLQTLGFVLNMVGESASIHLASDNSQVDVKAFVKLNPLQPVIINKTEKGCRLAKGKGFNKRSELLTAQKTQDFDELVRQGAEIKGCKVAQVKDYGAILTLPEPYQEMTGFLINEQANDLKVAKGQKLDCIVLDYDPTLKIIDLSCSKRPKIVQPPNLLSFQRLIVELNKENYLVVSMKEQPGVLGFITLFDFNWCLGQKNPHSDVLIGDEIEGKINQFVPEKNIYIFEAKENDQKTRSKAFELGPPGTQVQGIISSVKQVQAFVKFQGTSNIIGRLHRMVCSNFTDLQVGDRIKGKILYEPKQLEEGGKTFIEVGVTERKTMPKTVKDIKVGEVYEAMVTYSNQNLSCPLSLALSPQVSTKLLFSYCQLPLPSIGQYLKVKVDDISKTGDISVSQEGVHIQEIKEGAIVVARFVKETPLGATVQIGEKVFAFLEMVEASEELEVCPLKQLKTKGLFSVRVLKKQKDGKYLVSARKSMVDSNYDTITNPAKTALFSKMNEKLTKIGDQRNTIIKYNGVGSLEQGSLCLGYVLNVGKAGCFIKIGSNTTVRAALNELYDEVDVWSERICPGRIVIGRILKVEDLKGQKRVHFTLRKTAIVHGINRERATVGSELDVIVMAKSADALFGQVMGGKERAKLTLIKGVSVGDIVKITVTKSEKGVVKGDFKQKVQIDKEKIQESQFLTNLYESIEEIGLQEYKLLKAFNSENAEIDEDMIRKQPINDVAQQIQDLEDLEDDDDDDDDMLGEVEDDDSDADMVKDIIKESKVYDNSDQEDDDEEMGEEEQSEPEDKESEEEVKDNKKSKLSKRIQEEKDLRKTEQTLARPTNNPKTIEEFDKQLIANPNQSYIWLQYIAFMNDNLGIDAARRIAERAVKEVSMSEEAEKLNIWTGYINLEHTFGDKKTVEAAVKRAFDVNDRKKLSLNLIQIYKNAEKYDKVDELYRQLLKKYGDNLKIWQDYLEFIFETKTLSENPEMKFLIADLPSVDPKPVLQRALQSLEKPNHINIISKFGQLEFKNGNAENGRTMFEGVVRNFTKRLDIWSIYFDMESKYGDKEHAKALFEQCLENPVFKSKQKRMKMVFQKYMEFELGCGNMKAVEKLKKRVEAYLGSNEGEESEDE